MRCCYCTYAPRPSGEYAMSAMPSWSQSALVSLCCGPWLISENCTCARQVANLGHRRPKPHRGHSALPLRCTQTT